MTPAKREASVDWRRAVEAKQIVCHGAPATPAAAAAAPSVDGTVHARVGAAARGSQTADDRGIDRAVEGLAREVGVVGAASRRLQTGLAHDYYRLVAVGTLAVVLAAAAAVVGRHFF